MVSGNTQYNVFFDNIFFLLITLPYIPMTKYRNYNNLFVYLGFPHDRSLNFCLRTSIFETGFKHKESQTSLISKTREVKESDEYKI